MIPLPAHRLGTTPGSPADGTLVIDPGRDEATRYEDLRNRLSGAEVCFRPLLRPAELSELVVHLLAALAADRDITLVDPYLSAAELTVLGLSADDLDRVETAPNRHRADSPDALFASLRGRTSGRIGLLTSGTTGRPKPVRQPFANLGRTLQIGAHHARDVWGLLYNPTHIAGVQVLLQALSNRNPLVNLFRLPRETVLTALRRWQVTHLSATPSYFRSLLPPDAPLPLVRRVTLGGEPVDGALLARVQAAFPNARVRNVYASTEAGTLLTARGECFEIPDGLRDRVRVREGRLQVHASLLGETPEMPRDGADWFDTGDLVEPAGSGEGFRIVGRAGDWLKVGGNRVNPAEVEAVLLAHPGIREARVVGRPHSLIGSVLCAEVVAAGEPPSEPELRRFLGGRLLPHKVPRVIRVVAEVPVTRSGKVRHTAA